jgi:hypothetical protein
MVTEKSNYDFQHLIYIEDNYLFLKSGEKRIAVYKKLRKDLFIKHSHCEKRA